MSSELAKYQGIYAEQQADPARYARYGHSNHGKTALRLLAKWQPDSLLDLGCGHNEFCRSVKLALPALTTLGVDFACPGADLVHDIGALPFTDKQWDVATAFDVFEHIPPDDVDRVLAEMARVSRRFIVSISYVASVNKWRGETLHPTVRTEGWWLFRLARAGAVGITKHGRFITGQWAPPLRIPKEARVILVGNGPAILRGPYGRRIDDFDEVIRFNNYKIDGFETHTGTKTTLWSTFFKRIDAAQSHPRVLCIHEADKPAPACVEVYRIPSVCYNRIRDDLQRRAAWCSGFERDVNPLLASSGLLVAAYLLEVIGVQHIVLAGFDHFSKAKSSLHHYWINHAFKKPREHAGEIEAAMFAELQAAGRIAYL